VKGKKILQDLVAAGKPMPSMTGTAPVMRPAGAVKTMGIGLDRLSSEAAEARRLREEMASLEITQDIDPGLMSPSIVPDRIPSVDDAKYVELKSSIQANGQQIPIIVRPHPDEEGRYQIACGHRRWGIASELGIPVKAIVRKLTDAEMVILQGQENGPREDLSFIERARFALRMEERGLDRETISAALNVDKPEVSRLIGVAQTVGERLILAIGRAPKIGRPRWLKLVSGLEQEGAKARAEDVLGVSPFEDADTDKRFAIVLDAVGTKVKVAKRRLTKNAAASDQPAWIERDGDAVRLVSGNDRFSEFLRRRLPDLLKEFEASPEATGRA